MKYGFGLKIGDILLMGAIVCMALFLLLWPLFSTPAVTAEIVLAQTGETRIISLQKDASYEIASGGVTLTVCVADGEVFVSQSDCRDGICKSTPAISRAGQTIVCAPAGVVVRVLGEEAVVDGVSK